MPIDKLGIKGQDFKLENTFGDEVQLKKAGQQEKLEQLIKGNIEQCKPQIDLKTKGIKTDIEHAKIEAMLGLESTIVRAEGQSNDPVAFPMGDGLAGANEAMKRWYKDGCGKENPKEISSFAAEDEESKPRRRGAPTSCCVIS